MESFVEKVYATFWKKFQSPIECFILVLLLSSCTHRIPHKFKSYDRSEWSHWSDPDKDCQNTRQEILIIRSKIKVKLNKKGCTVISGLWSDYYFPEEHKLAKNVDIDHLIPLKHAHEVGGANWTQKEKEQFANDPENLVITNKSYNRKKGAKTIAEWLPIHRERTCLYIKDWVRIKRKYHLILKEEEYETIKLSGCTESDLGQ